MSGSSCWRTARLDTRFGVIWIEFIRRLKVGTFGVLLDFSNRRPPSIYMSVSMNIIDWSYFSYEPTSSSKFSRLMLPEIWFFALTAFIISSARDCTFDSDWNFSKKSARDILFLKGE